MASFLRLSRLVETTALRAPLPRRMTVLLNPGGGNASRNRVEPEELAELFRDAGIDAEVKAIEGPDIAAAVEEAVAQGAEAVVAAGGDGTVHTVAGALAGGEVPMAVLPLGTFNHVAADLGMPENLEEAVAALADGEIRRIDLAEINGVPIINNATLGFYAAVVAERREPRRHRSRLTKYLRTMAAALRLLPRFPVAHVWLELDGEEIFRTTPFLFVSNNEPEMSFFSFGRRARLDGGRLFLYSLKRRGRWGLVRVLVAALAKRLRRHQDFESWQARETRVETHSPARVFVDGELYLLDSPLKLRIHPRALPVIAPVAASSPG